MITPADILNARILIVDDIEANVRLLQQMLSDAGYSCVESTMDSSTVCAMHRKQAYDLILLDLLMPGMDGFEVLAGLRGIEAFGYVPVLVITAQPGHKQRALQAGAKDFVSKPFDLVEVKARIHNLLEVRLLYRQLGQQNQLLEQTVLQRTAALRQSEERFQRFTELSADWFWEQDAAGNYTFVSGPAVEIIGSGNDGDAALQANIAERRPFLDHICMHTNADGSQQYFQISGEPYFGPGGTYAGYRGIGLDVTKRIRAEG